MPPSPPKPLSSEDLFRLAFVGSPRLSPDGAWVAYTVKHAELEGNRYRSNLYLVPAAGGASRRLTFAEAGEGLPRWSPDGKTLAFVSDREEKRQQVYLLPLDGGEARRLTDVDGMITGLAWAPDGKRLVMAYRPLSREQIARRQAEKEGKAEKRAAFKVLSTLHFKEDGFGFLFDTHQHLYLVDVESGAVTRLTDGDTDDMQPVVSPDGTTVAFVSNRMENPLLNLDNLDLCTVPVAGGEITRLTPKYGPNAGPAFSPDGKTLAFVGHFCEKGAAFWDDFHLWTVPVSGGEPVDLTPDLGRPAGNWTISDVREVGDPWEPPVWSPDGGTLYFLLSDSGSVHLCRIPSGGGEVERLTPAGRELDGLSVDAAGRRLAMTVSDPVRPGEVAVLEPIAPGEPRLLTRHNEAFLSERWVGKPEEVWIPTAPGVRIQGWILKPPGFRAGRKYPAILEIHGGPHMQYGNTFFHEMQFLAGQGYVVFWTNPQGSQGYGETFTRAIVNDWGGPDYVDLMKAVDFLVDQGYVDEARLGVTGGSYGGFMTNWMIGHTDRFRAAVTQRSVVDLYSFYGESDFGYEFEWELAGRPWEDDETALRFLRMSPIRYVKNMKTPLLIIHSEEDHRCPVSQAEELFTALKVLGRDVEFVRFEGESHGLSRGGRPKNRLERLQRIAGWFDEHL